MQGGTTKNFQQVVGGQLLNFNLVLGPDQPTPDRTPTLIPTLWAARGR